MLSFVYDITNAQFVNNRCKRIEEQLLNYGATEYENEINTNDPDRIRAEVDEMFDSYCEKYKDANEIRDVLKGL